MAQVASTRWYPTPEQLTILRTMYRGGVRSLSGSQIQQMAAYLSLYGRIEAKNVFYWFQNRKARDRQKLRRRLTKQHTKTASSATHVLLQQQSFHPQVQTWFARSHPLHHQAQAFPVSQGGYGTTQVVNELVYNLEAYKTKCEAGKDVQKMASSERGWIQIMDLDITNIKPVETLELFPTNNGDLK